MHAVVHTLDVDAKDSLEILFAGGLELADVRDAGIVDQNVDGIASPNLAKDVLNLLLTRDVAQVPLRRASVVANLCGDPLSVRGVDFQNMDARASLGKAKRNGFPDAARPTGNDRGFAVESKQLRIIAVEIQSETPLFQGMKSSWPSSSALVFTSPLAILIISSRMRSPASSTDSSPAMMVPVSISIASDMRCAN